MSRNPIHTHVSLPNPEFQFFPCLNSSPFLTQSHSLLETVSLNPRPTVPNLELPNSPSQLPFLLLLAGSFAISPHNLNNPSADSLYQIFDRGGGEDFSYCDIDIHFWGKGENISLALFIMNKE